MDVGEEEKKKKVGLIHVALHQIMEERRKDMEEGRHHPVCDQREGDESLLLSRLLSKVESLERDFGDTHSPEVLSDVTDPSPSAPVAGDCQTRAMEADAIVRELRRLRRQNLITHCLLSVMIVVTVFWQFSEVTLLLKVKKKFSHPFRSIRDMIAGSLKEQGKKHSVEVLSPPFPSISVPELPHVDLPSLTMHSHEN